MLGLASVPSPGHSCDSNGGSHGEQEEAEPRAETPMGPSLELTWM